MSRSEWTIVHTAGERGYKVSVVRRAQSPNLYVRWWDRQKQQWRYKSLKHRNMLAAKKAAEIQTSQRRKIDTDVPGVYIVHAEGTIYYKIGFSGSIQNRLRALQAACPLKIRAVLVLPGADISLERELHRRFRAYRRHGEWFEVCAELLAYIDSLNSASHARDGEGPAAGDDRNGDARGTRAG